jgi:hypothetical protein
MTEIDANCSDRKLDPIVIIREIDKFVKKLEFEKTELVLTGENSSSSLLLLCYHEKNIKYRTIQKTSQHNAEGVYMFKTFMGSDMISGIYSVMGFEFLSVSMDRIIVFRKENIPKGWVEFSPPIPNMQFVSIQFTFKAMIPLPPLPLPIPKESLKGYLDNIHSTVIIECVMLLTEDRDQMTKILYH